MSIAALRASSTRCFHPYARRSIVKGPLNKQQLSYVFNIFRKSQNRPYSTISYLPGEKGDEMDQKLSAAYKGLCTEYYELDKPHAPPDALSYYLKQAEEAKGPILEPMCGTGRFLVPLLKKGYLVTGFDSSHHMLNVCRKKCQVEGLNAALLKGSFENFSSNHTYQLIFIPSGSFCLLTEPAQVAQALKMVVKHLGDKGKFVFEVDTLKSINEPQEVWKGHWIDKPDGSKLVLNTFSRFDSASRINTILCRYELWEKNSITKTEVEDFRVRLYDTQEVEQMLKHHQFKLVNKCVPYTTAQPDEKSESILYECVKL